MMGCLLGQMGFTLSGDLFYHSPSVDSQSYLVCFETFFELFLLLIIYVVVTCYIVTWYLVKGPGH